jgi:DUF1680 family protein
VFQAREGSPELNCCSVNGPRGLGMLVEWAVMRAPNGLALNYYGPGTFSVTLPSGNRVAIEQRTNYPVDGHVFISVRPAQPERFNLELRIPAWSAHTRITMQGEDIAPGMSAAQYWTISHEWRGDDEIEVWLDMSPHVWVGEREAQGRVSIYRGPLLLAYDRAYNTLDPHELPVLTPQAIQDMTLQPCDGPEPPWSLWRVEGAGSNPLFLCDFASAGVSGTPYRTWLPAQGFTPQSFSREQPIWCARVSG